MMDNLLEIITARGSQKFHKLMEVRSVTNATDEIEVTMIFLMVTFFVAI